MAANKFVAVFLVCVVVVAALQVPKAAAEDEFDLKYKSCFTTCKNECTNDGKGSSVCEVKCDNDCGAKEVADKLNINVKA